MELKVIGSSSAGNCYLLTDSKGNKLMLEAGVRLAEVKRVMNYDLGKIKGCLITHEHGDHAKYVECIRDKGIGIYCSLGTADALKLNSFNKVYDGQNEFSIGPYRVIPFKAYHNTEEPLNFKIYHKEMGVLVFITDNSRYVGINYELAEHWLIEANYCKSDVEHLCLDGKMSGNHARRLFEDHMSLESAIEVISDNKHEGLKNVIFCHVSEVNGYHNKWIEELYDYTGIVPKIAAKGLTVNLQK
jgi:phosphoribosyl 1,2-cyclic phosphodiesterase